MPFYIVLNPHGIGDVRKEGTYIGKKECPMTEFKPEIYSVESDHCSTATAPNRHFYKSKWLLAVDSFLKQALTMRER